MARQLCHRRCYHTKGQNLSTHQSSILLCRNDRYSVEQYRNKLIERHSGTNEQTNNKQHLEFSNKVNNIYNIYIIYILYILYFSPHLKISYCSFVRLFGFLLSLTLFLRNLTFLQKLTITCISTSLFHKTPIVKISRLKVKTRTQADISGQ